VIWRRRVLLFLLVAVLAASVHAVAAEREEFDGLPIVSIIFERSDIFDTSQPKTSHWLYRWANALHIVSKEGFVRQMILFEEGDPYSSRLAAESERILRDLGFINPVRITPRRVEGGVEVTVSTHDTWTLEVGAQFGLFGDREEFAVEFQENHFLGWGKMVEIEYRSDQERDTWRYRYQDPNIIGSRWRTDLIHEDTSDGHLDFVALERPFYSLATKLAWGGSWQSELLTEHLYSESESVVSGRRDTDAWTAWFGFRLPSPGDISRRINVGVESRTDRFDDWQWRQDGLPYPAPDDREISGPRLVYQQIPDRFIVLRGYRAWTRQEDVALGPTFRLGATLSTPETGGDIERMLLDGALSVAARSDDWVFAGNSWFEGRFDEGDPRNWFLGLQATASMLGDRGWQFRLLAEVSHEPDLDRQLTLGADVGLRGWDPDFFDGTGRALANLQWRSLIKRDLLQILSLGVVAFVDAGATWDARVGRDTDGIRANLGLGLLADLTTIGSTNVVRLEVALPDDGSGVTFIVSSGTLF
jgi:hypothetical protein